MRIKHAKPHHFRKLRDTLGWSQVRTAAELGVTENTIARAEQRGAPWPLWLALLAMSQGWRPVEGGDAPALHAPVKLGVHPSWTGGILRMKESDDAL